MMTGVSHAPLLLLGVVFLCFSSRDTSAFFSTGRGGVSSTLKRDLLAKCRQCNRGASATQAQAETIIRLAEDLAKLNPTENAATSALLNAKWDLEFTTEKEVIFLIEKGFFGFKTGPVYQVIDNSANTLENTLRFGNLLEQEDNFFSVQSATEPLPNSSRTAFKFTSCEAGYRGFKIPLPPVGAGAFDTIFLDQELRISKDTRGDVLICSRSA